MRQKSETQVQSSEQVVKDIRRATRKQYSSEEKIRIVLDGLRGEYSIAELCRREGIAESLYYSWSKEFLEAGKRWLAGDTERSANTGEVKELRREMREQGMLTFQKGKVVFDHYDALIKFATFDRTYLDHEGLLLL